MLINFVRIARLGTGLACVAVTAAVIALAVMPHALGLLDREMYVVRGSSMHPAIPLGAVTVVRHSDVSGIQVGDVVTFHAPNDAVVTHRVVGVVSDEPLVFQTKGDASLSADPIAVPASAVVGRVESFIPSLGLILTVLASLPGALAMLGLVGGLMLTSWFLDELGAVLGTASQRRTVSQPAH